MGRVDKVAGSCLVASLLSFVKKEAGKERRTHGERERRKGDLLCLFNAEEREEKK